MRSETCSRVQEVTIARRAMACEFTVTIPAGRGGEVAAGCAALDEVERLEETLSVYRDQSAVSALNRQAAAGPVRVDGELYGLLRAAAALSAATGGAFDAASGALVDVWGFFRGPNRVPDETALAAALAACGSRHILFDDREQSVRFARPGLWLSLGGIGKGFAIDRALERVRSGHAVRAAFMQGGQSSLKGIGAPAGQPRGWAVDIQIPGPAGRAAARVWLRDRALGTSGAGHRFFVEGGRRFGHVLDPRTGRPAGQLLAASAVARTALEADALSTAFFVLGVEGTRRFCARHRQVSAILIAPHKAILLGDADMEVLDA